MRDKATTKREFMALLGATAGGIGFGTSTVGASSNYGSTVDIVEAGADNTGNAPIDDVLDSVVEDDTLVQFPPGTYLLEREHDFTRSNHVGLVSTGGKSETTLKVESGFNGATLFDFGSSGSYASTNVEIRGFTYDQTASGAGTMFFWAYMNRGLLIEDVDIVGQVEGPREAGKGEILIRVDVMDSDGDATIRRVRANDGAIYDDGGDPAGPGFYVGGLHAGHVLFEDCEAANWLDNGLYTSDASEGGGDVTIRGGVFKNNDVGNVRVGGINSLVEDVTIVQNDTSHMAPDMLNPRGLFCRNGNATIRNVDITYSDGANTSWPILIRDTMGDVTLENITIEHATDNATIYDRGSDSLTINNMTVKATVDGAKLVEASSNGAMSITDSCFQATTGSRDGIDANSVDASIENCNINVPGDEIMGSDVTQSNISTDLGCSISGNDSPVASFNISPSDPAVDETVTLDGSASSDSDGSVQSYDWAVEEPSGSSSSLSGQEATYTPSESGTYGISLTVTDDAGAQTTSNQELTVGTESTPSENTFEVVAAEESGGGFDYEFTTNGPVTAVTDAGSNAADDNDTITDNGDGTYTVSGRTGSGYGDTFGVDGDVTAFSTATDASNYTLYWNDQEITADDINGDQPSTDTFEVVAAEDSGGAFDYTFTADGEVTAVTDAGSNAADDNDTITDNGDGTYTVSGRTGSGYGDTFSIAGEVTSFETSTDASNYTLYLNGEEVSFGGDEPTESENTFQVVAAEDSGGAFNYTFTAEGQVTADGDAGDNSAEGNDKITENGDGTYTVSGRTGSGFGDTFTVVGSVTAFDCDTDASNYTLVWNGATVTESTLVN
jgi:hypothetical protein